ncbi:MAG: DUF349 domain-containing protein [Bacteroidia bacterium]|nr:DUF349 domain-containing protein [Bacteroidia bacterium]MDW8157784.1 DUF349 domain-containing protein [Bacteroidia bacterium]
MSDININPEEQKGVEKLEQTSTATLNSTESQTNADIKASEVERTVVSETESLKSGFSSKEDFSTENADASQEQWKEGNTFSLQTEAEERRISENVTPLNASLDEFESFLEEGDLETFITYIQQFAGAEINRNNIRKVGRLKKAFDQLYQSKVKQIKDTIPDSDIEAREKERERLSKLKTKFEASLQKFNERKNEFEEQDKKIKQANIDKKKALLDELREIVMSEDVTAIEKVRKIQENWKQIGPVPVEEAEIIYQSYRHFIEQFYRLRDSYNELVEQDRKINLEEKEKLISELISLIPTDVSKVEPGYWQDAAEKVKSLHELWKTIGPVPRSKSDEVWKRFKDYTDQFYSLRRSFFEQLDNQRLHNAERKKELLLKFQEYANYESSNLEDWRRATEEIQSLQRQWKEIGSAPASINKDLNTQMRKLVDDFFERRKSYFGELDQEKEEILEKKRSLLRQAEELKNNEDWIATAEMLKQIQKEWKTTGPDNFKEAKKLRKSFRRACDIFFKRHKQHFQELRAQEEENLKKKQAICEQMEALLEKGEGENIKEEIQKLKQEFEAIGRVPIKEKDKIQSRFHKLYTRFLQKIIKDPYERDLLTLESKIKVLQSLPNGAQRFQQEERKYIKKIKALEDKIQQYETNFMFISQSKGSDSLRRQIESKIKSAKERKQRLEQSLKIMRQASKASSANTKA